MSSSQNDQRDLAAIRAWLDAFAAAVRKRDFTAGRALFADSVVAFGSIENICRGIDALEQSQWRNVWPRTTDYQIELASSDLCNESNLAWAAATWSSLGNVDGQTFQRTGRATFVWRRRGDVWLAVHSHHSFDPDLAQRR